ncbi:hypothetical protein CHINAEXTREME_11515 [Halobiforma lacisalsi AJ5]|uniref:Uncharacterized protein n=1 Tax=Natronobacterium lacisalsi AJ5 TaxID=358396 RepID=M0L359_NATLA|nr:hypothetical protein CHINAEXTREME_11515 [Halobiforma lacisalsi AJ5]EMA27981.1 hypothetical protein C445_20067 [Halobiforma lacisalsi AJ5]
MADCDFDDTFEEYGEKVIDAQFSTRFWSGRSRSVFERAQHIETRENRTTIRPLPDRQHGSRSVRRQRGSVRIADDLGTERFESPHD